MGKHDGHFDTQHTLAHEHVAHGSVDVLDSTLAGLDHVTIREFLALGTLSTHLSAHRHLGSLGARLHHEAEDTVARTTHGKSAQQLVLEGLGLGLGAQAAVGHALSVELDTALGEVESVHKSMKEKELVSAGEVLRPLMAH